MSDHSKAEKIAAKTDLKMRTLEYFINLDERGEFYADIRDYEGNTLIEIDTKEAFFLSDEGVKVREPESVLNYYKDSIFERFKIRNPIIKRGN